MADEESNIRSRFILAWDVETVKKVAERRRRVVFKPVYGAVLKKENQKYAKLTKNCYFSYLLSLELSELQNMIIMNG